jgi:hypothetical protein
MRREAGREDSLDKEQESIIIINHVFYYTEDLKAEERNKIITNYTINYILFKEFTKEKGRGRVFVGLYTILFVLAWWSES